MPYLKEKSSPREVFGPTSADEIFFENYQRFLADVKVGASRQISADRLVAQMLPGLGDPSVSIYRRTMSRLAIAYLGMLYILQGYTYTTLKEITQQCLNLFKNVRIRCNPKYFQRVFATHQDTAKDLRTWYEKKICISGLRDHMSRRQIEMDFQRRAEEDFRVELEDTRGLLKRNTI